MTTEPPRTETTFEELDALPTEELREQAFNRAWHHRDLGFFVNVIRILPASEDAEQIDGSFASFGTTLSDIVGIWREFTGHGYGVEEPLVRATFIDYLLKK
jgi:hypothetical protein